MHEEIVENNILKIPLFHGTSTLFEESIRRYGLGGVNPIKHYSVREFVCEAYKICDEVYSGDEKWEAFKFSPRLLIDQESFNDHVNFQHGDTYLTPSRQSAVSYALTNKFGSELLSMGARLVDLIKGRRPELISQSPLNNSPVMSLISSDSQPILVTIQDIPVNILLSESGNAPDEQIQSVKTLWSLIYDGKSVVNINFRLCGIISQSLLEVERLNPMCEENSYDW